MACAAEVAGISYGQMGSRIVRMAARRHPVFGRAAFAREGDKKKTAARKPRVRRVTPLPTPRTS